MRTHHRTWLTDVTQATSSAQRHSANLASGFVGFWRGLWWRARHSSFASLKPGWLILIGLLALYALWATFALIGARRELARVGVNTPITRSINPTAATPVISQPNIVPSKLQLVWPLEGAHMPRASTNLPGALRSYRSGRSQGFTFSGSDSGIKVRYGMPVRAAADGVVIKSDHNYQASTETAYRKLLRNVRNGASETQLNQLRGRQVWIKHSDGTVTRYGHLSRIASDIGLGNVTTGQVIGYVGNSGTLEETRGTKLNARLQFEIWRNNGKFFGTGMSPAQVRAAANGIFP